jgi:hypothetical protein
VPATINGRVDDMAEAFDVRRPFTRAAAVRNGISPKTLRGPRFRRILRGVFVDASLPRWDEERIDAALLLFDASAFHASAARLLGVPIPTSPDEHVSVLDPGHRRRREGVVCHLAVDGDIVRVRGRRCSSAVALFGELAASLDLVDLVVVGDHLVRRGLASVGSLREVAATLTGPTGRQARRAAAYVRAGVDSPMETRLRMLLVLSGLPEPTINHTIRDVDGEPVRRFDLSWPSVEVIVEYDGRHHVAREQTWERDLDRREWIDDGGWRLRVVTARGVYVEPARTVERVFGVLRMRGLPGLPTRPRDDWRPHFPGHTTAA